MRKERIVAIVGPTASGKTSLAIALAKRFNGEVISADSRQVYRGMDIGSGKATRREMRGVPHHMLDVASPRRTFTAAEYQKLGKIALKKILKKSKLPIVAGGTGFYVDSLLYDYAFPSVKPDAKLRRKLEAQSTEKLFMQLQQRDPRRAATIDRHNRRRLVRALEIILSTKKPVPDLELFKFKTHYDILKIGIDPGQEILKHNIHKRLLARLRGGKMENEVRELHKNGLSWERLDTFGLEYRYVSRYLRGQIDKKKMMHEIEKESYRFAKRQMRWFKRDNSVRWVRNAQAAVPLAQKFLK